MEEGASRLLSSRDEVSCPIVVTFPGFGYLDDVLGVMGKRFECLVVQILKSASPPDHRTLVFFSSNL